MRTLVSDLTRRAAVLTREALLPALFLGLVFGLVGAVFLLPAPVLALG